MSDKLTLGEVLYNRAFEFLTSQPLGVRLQHDKTLQAVTQAITQAVAESMQTREQALLDSVTTAFTKVLKRKVDKPQKDDDV